MSSLFKRIEQTFADIASNPNTTELFALERIHRASGGLAEESITLQRGQQQRFLRTRNFTDEGNIPIGIWELPSNPQHLQQVAQALIDIQIWNVPDQPINPGGEYYSWRYVTSEGVGLLHCSANTELLMKTYPLDQLLLQITNGLIGHHQGSEMLCQIRLEKIKHQLIAWCSLNNQGNKNGIIPNPFLLARDRADYFRIEMGTAPENAVGLTDAGVRYEPLPLPKLDSLPAPWDSPFLLLRANSSLEVPFQVPIPTPEKKGTYVRAVYSCYRAPSQMAGMPVIRGQAFSEEKELVV